MKNETGNWIMAAVVAIGMGTGGCSAEKAPAQFIDAVQTATLTACSFLPLASTIAAIVTANASLPVSSVAEAICMAVKEQAGKPGAQRYGEPYAAGEIKIGEQTIPVEGRFIKPAP